MPVVWSPRAGRGADLLEGGGQHLFQRDGGLPVARARELVDGLLGAIDERLHVADVAVPLGRDALARGDEAPHPPLLVHDARVGGDVAHGGHRVEQLGHVGGSTDLGEALAVAQPRRDGHHVDRRARLGERDHGLVDAAVRLAVEVLGLEQLEHPIERVTLQQHGREHRGLGVEVVRRHTPRHDGRLAGSLSLAERRTRHSSPPLRALETSRQTERRPEEHAPGASASVARSRGLRSRGSRRANASNGIPRRLDASGRDHLAFTITDTLAVMLEASLITAV